MRQDKNISPIVGIDLGTTHSLVAIVRNGIPEILNSREGKHLVPSVVSFIENEPVVGYQAKQKKVRDSQHTVFSVKRLLGLGLKDLEVIQDSLPYELVLSSEGDSVEGDSVPRIRVGDRTYTAIEVSALILKELRLSAEEALGCPVSRAVITVPAYFNDAQRQATRMAGRLAGLDVLRILNEPTAASLAYGLDRKKQGLVAVYDFGGGTFDVSILKLRDGIFEVLATQGDTALGGDDLDQALVEVAKRELQAEGSWDPSVQAALLESAERTKIALSDHAEATFEVTLKDGQVYRRLWTREEFESLIRPWVERTRAPCVNAMKDAGLDFSDLSDVVLVGGPTRLAVVQQVAESIFGRKPNTSMHPDEVVAEGAAIQADILAGNNSEFLLLDVVPLSLGLETYGGVMSPIIPRNTKIPTVVREVFTTFVDRQTAVDIHVLQGEREKVQDNRSLARFKLKGIQPLPAGMARIEVTFLIDADGVLQVAAKDLKTGLEQAMEVRPSYGLTEAEIQKIIGQSLENADRDVLFRRLVVVRNQAEPLLRAAEKTWPQASRLLPAEDVRIIESAILRLKVALGQDNPEEIDQASLHLNRSTIRLAELLDQGSSNRK